MTIALHTNFVLGSGSFEGERDALIKAGENLPLWLYSRGAGGNSNGLSPRLDSLGRQFIGYGYDLAANVESAFDDLSDAGATITVTAEQLKTAINNGSVTASQVRLPDTAAADGLLQVAINNRIEAFNRFMRENISDLAADSREKAVLFSMWYQAPGGTKPDGRPGKNGYFMNADSSLTQMVKALQSGNRAEAWYQIRYVSAKNGTQGLGIVVRRFAEAEIFSLYNPDVTASNIEDLDAKDVFRMYTKHKVGIEAYEKKFGIWEGQTGTIRDANGRLPLFAANQDYGLAGDMAVDTIYEALQPARTYLITEYVSDKGISADIDGDILVGSDSSTMGSGVAGQDGLSGSTDNDLMFGEGGNDALVGASGDDVLYGGTGNDILQGGSGNDTYVYESGDGNDTIDDSDGQGKILIETGSTLSGSDKKAYLEGYRERWESADGQIHYSLLDGNLKDGGTLQIDGGALGGGKITVKHFKNDDLGIHLNGTYQIALLKGGEANPYTQADASPPTFSADMAERGSKILKVVLNKGAKAGDKIILKATGGDASLLSAVRGDDTVSFSSGQVELDLEEGQTEIAIDIGWILNSAVNDVEWSVAA